MCEIDVGAALEFTVGRIRPLGRWLDTPALDVTHIGTYYNILCVINSFS